MMRRPLFRRVGTVLTFLLLTLGGAARVAAAGLTLEPEAVARVAVAEPLFSARLGRVSFDKGDACTTCGDFDDDQGFDASHVNDRLGLNTEVTLRQALKDSGLFTNDARERLGLRVKLLKLQRDSSAGRAAEKKSVLTGAVLTAQLVLRYELTRSDEVVGYWEIGSMAKSNRVATRARLQETLDGAIARNIQAFILKLRLDYGGEADKANANATLAAMLEESKDGSTRSLAESAVYVVAKTVSMTVGAVGSVAAETITFMAHNPDVMRNATDSIVRQREANNRAATHAMNEYTRSTVRASSSSGSGGTAGANDDKDKAAAGTTTGSASRTAVGAGAPGTAGPVVAAGVGGSSPSGTAGGGGVGAVSSGKSAGGNTATASSGGRAGGGLVLTRKDDSAERAEEERARAAAQKQQEEALAKERAEWEALQRKEQEARAAQEARTRQMCMAEAAQGRYPCGCAPYVSAPPSSSGGASGCSK